MTWRITCKSCLPSEMLQWRDCGPWSAFTLVLSCERRFVEAACRLFLMRGWRPCGWRWESLVQTASNLTQPLPLYKMWAFAGFVVIWCSGNNKCFSFQPVITSLCLWAFQLFASLSQRCLRVQSAPKDDFTVWNMGKEIASIFSVELAVPDLYTRGRTIPRQETI